MSIAFGVKSMANSGRKQKKSALKLRKWCEESVFDYMQIPVGKRPLFIHRPFFILISTYFLINLFLWHILWLQFLDNQIFAILVLWKIRLPKVADACNLF